MNARWMAWYASAVGALGVMPFLAVRLTDGGFSDAGAAATLAMIPLGTLFGGPLWALWIDRTGAALTTLRFALVAEALAIALLILPLPPWALAVSIALFAAVRGPVFPVADAITVERVGRGYGTIRAIGSLGYVGVVLFTGALRDTQPGVPLALGATLLAVAAALTVGLPNPPSVAPPRLDDHRALLASPSVRALLFVAFMNGLPIAAYDHLFTLHLERVGIGGDASGAAVAWGVLVEVGVLLAGPRLLGAVGAGRLLALACAVGVPRFLLTAWATDPWLIGLTQGLHGVQFGAFWIAAVDRMAVAAPANLSRSGQALLPAVAFGLATLCALGLGSLALAYGSSSELFALSAVPALLAAIAAWRTRDEPSR